ncbi:hypothetical protein Godav_021791 [Gossypium davidsonii]|uniref:RNase H type-1 domain-containing protein n=2 Tax=Gossypium TaxID=3633 RepID=A0A7J8T5T1_GOSDV|nr:hypothetical protein [Gossypium davidsonii]MBA0648279.1 hypothetical protein [Gossypium klotzschianum]
MPAEWVELEAFEESLKVENRFNISKAVLELDYASLVNRVNNQGKDITVLGNRLNEVCKQLEKFDSVKIAWANRSCNRVAGFIYDFAINNKCNWNFNMDYPSKIHVLVMNGAIN